MPSIGIFLKTTSFIELAVEKKLTEQDCTQVDHNQLDPLPFKILHTNAVLFFVVAGSL